MKGQVLYGSRRLEKGVVVASVELNEKNFKETLDKNDVVVLDFWASWCGPCKMFGPIFEKVSESFPDVIFGKVNTDVEQGLAQHFGVRSIPTVIVMRESMILFENPGVIGERDLTEVVSKIQSLDMEEIKKQAAAAEATEEA
jgi:thioredoxin